MLVVDCAAEVGAAQLGDRRRRDRAVAILEAIQRDPSRSFPTMFTDAELEAFYRFTNNDAVEAAKLLAPHVGETLKRADAGQSRLILHDTTEASFPGDAPRDGLHFTGTRNTIQLHVSLAVDLVEAPVVHGIADLRAYVVERGRYREVKNGGKTRALAVGSKRWGSAVARVHAASKSKGLIHVMDREADDFLLWNQIIELGDDFVIRAAQDRRTIGDADHLFDTLSDTAISFERTVHVSPRSRIGRTPSKQHPPRDARQARLGVRSGPVDVRRSKKLPAAATPSSLRLNVVEVFEIEPPNDEEPVSWWLITTLPIDTPENVSRIIDIYRKRWLIEEYFKALKSGCRLEERQAESRWSVMNVIALLAPVAVRLLHIRALGRHVETATAPAMLDEEELDALRAMPRAKLPRRPTNRDVMFAIARLGGLIKQNGEPGWIVLGRGHATFLSFLDGWRAARQKAPRESTAKAHLRRSDR